MSGLIFLYLVFSKVFFQMSIFVDFCCRLEVFIVHPSQTGLELGQIEPELAGNVTCDTIARAIRDSRNVQYGKR